MHVQFRYAAFDRLRIHAGICSRALCSSQQFQVIGTHALFAPVLFCKAMNVDALCNDVLNFHSWVEGSIWILKDHLHLTIKLLKISGRFLS